MSTITRDLAAPSYSPSVSTSLEPVAPAERIAALDLLRGWAMFGVLWSNLNDWYGTADPTTQLDRALSFTQDWFVESRFYTLLLFLFGIGFGIQLTRAAARGASVRTTYLRRSAALLAIGLVHGLFIWSGDILTMYALASFALLLFRDLTPRRQLMSGLLLWIFGGYLVRRLRFLVGMRIMVPRIPNATGNWIYTHGTLGQIHAERVLRYTDWFGRWGLTTYISVLALFLVGVWTVRSGFLQRVVTDPRLTRKVALVSAVVALIGYGAVLYGPKLLPSSATFPASALDWRLWFPSEPIYSVIGLATEATAVLYAALLLLAFQTSLGKRILAPLAATGRMALTTYLTQSVVCTFLFYSYGLRWLGTRSFTNMFEITVTLFAVQMVLSTWWLRRFRFGPVEWLWRTLTYGRAPAMRAG
jgi:uncharacterized protein